MDKKEALGKKPSLKKKLALGMKKWGEEPSTKHAKQEEEERKKGAGRFNLKADAPAFT